MKLKENIHIGTSRWSYKHWKGIFYPEEVQPADYDVGGHALHNAEKLRQMIGQSAMQTSH